MTEKGSIQLVLADVDGTLVTDNKILTERACNAVRNLRSSGIKFAITSGRPPRGMKMLVEPLQLDTPIAGFNGGVLVSCDMSAIEERKLSQEVAELTIELIQRHGLVAWLYTADQWIITDPAAAHVARESWTVKFKPIVVTNLSSYLKRAVKIVGVSDDLGAVQECEADAQKAVGQQATAARSQPYYLDVTHKDANKGVVVETLARMLGLSISDVATIGDQPNDVLMFEKSGMSIAMGNASDDVKKKAHQVTTSNEDEGFANAIEEFVLGH